MPAIIKGLFRSADPSIRNKPTSIGRATNPYSGTMLGIAARALSGGNRKAYATYAHNWALEGSVIDIDFTREAYKGLRASDITCARVSPGMIDDANGIWKEIAANIPRISNKGILCEAARTNSIRNSSMQGAVVGTPGTIPTNWVFATPSGLTRSIVGIGTEKGIDYIDIRWVGTTIDSNPFQIYFEGTTGIAATSGQQFTHSAFIKLQAGSLNGINATRFGIDERAAAGVYISTILSANIILDDTLNRISHTKTMLQATAAFVMPFFQMTQTSGAVIDITIRIGWPQTELGSNSSSPIRTSGSAVLRTSDFISSQASALIALLRTGSFTIRTQLRHGSAIRSSGGWFGARAGGSNRIDDRSRGTPNEAAPATGGFDSVGGALAYGASAVLNMAANQRSAIVNRHRPAELAVCSNGGALVKQVTNPLTTNDIDTVYFGVDATQNNKLDGYIERITVYGDLTDSEAAALAIVK